MNDSLPAPTATTSKTCRCCGGQFDLSCFRPLRRGSPKRVATCKFCRRIKDRIRESTRLSDEKKQRFKRTINLISKTGSDRRRLQFLDATILKFGGPEKFADKLHECYQATQDQRLRFRILKMLADVSFAADQVSD